MYIGLQADSPLSIGPQRFCLRSMPGMLRLVGVYEAANDIATSIKAILYFSASELTRVQTILKELDLAERRDVVLIDARPVNKASASNVRDE